MRGTPVPTLIALHAASSVALDTAAAFVAINAEQGVPSEIMVLPPGGVIQTVDGRGPYQVADYARLANESLAAAGGKLPIDENHAIDLAGPHGGPSPARGWITGLHARADGLFATVEWTESGKALVADKAYRGISPVFRHTDKGQVTRLLRASLTNVPNLRGQSALHAEGADMEAVLAKLKQMLGLSNDAKEEDIWRSLSAVIDAAAAEKAQRAVAMQAALTPIAKAAGLKDDADATAIAAAVTTLATESKGDGKTVAALQAELVTVTEKLNTLQTGIATERATAFVDGAIREGRVGVKPLRDHYIARHAQDPAAVEKEIGAFPIVGRSGASIDPPKPDKDGNIALNAEQTQVAKLLNIKPEDMQKRLAAEAAAREEAA